MSRIAHQEYYLTPEEKDHLVNLIRRATFFSGLRLLAYCVMSNHFHVFVYLPERPAEMPSDVEMLSRIAALYGETYARCVMAEWDRLESLREGLSRDDRESYFMRMYDISEFMKAIKQRYSMSFNNENEHFGTMWEGRFKSVCVQATSSPMSAVSAYDDLNPIRAGIVVDLSDYPWCSWSAALRGDEVSQAGYRFIYGMSDTAWAEVAVQHASVMHEKAAYFDRASRSFIEGGAIGDDGFVREYAAMYFPKNRKTLPQKLVGGNVWGEVRVARELRQKRVSSMGSDPIPEKTGMGSDPMPEREVT